MRFLLVASYPDSILKFRGSLITAVQNNGLQVHVAAPDLSLGSAVREQLEKLNVHVHEIPLSRTGMNPLTDIKTLISLWRLLARIKPEFVLSYTIKPVIYTSYAARLLGLTNCNAMITGLGYTFKDHIGFNNARLVGYITKKMYLQALKKANTVFFQNPDDERAFKKLKIISSGTNSVIINGSGIDIDEYPATELPSEPSFLLIARLISSKGIREYVEAARQIRKKHPSMKFSLVGWIDKNPDSISEAELNSWIVEGIIDYKGKLDDVRKAITDCSIYVLPSYSEGTPRTVLEAMAMGRAIITTDAPGCRETVCNGCNGFLVPTKDVPALVDAMRNFIENPILIKEMGLQSRQIAVQKYNVHKVNNVLLRSMQIT